MLEKRSLQAELGALNRVFTLVDDSKRTEPEDDSLIYRNTLK